MVIRRKLRLGWLVGNLLCGLMLAMIILPTFTMERGPKRPSAASADLRSFITALETYKLENGSFPPANTSLLTTPVAYLNRNVDRYAQDKTSGYNYISEGDSILVYSRGPDEDFDLVPQVGFIARQDFLIINTYNPTNGTLSSGDIWRTTPSISLAHD